MSINEQVSSACSQLLHAAYRLRDEAQSGNIQSAVAELIHAENQISDSHPQKTNHP